MERNELYLTGLEQKIKDHLDTQGLIKDRDYYEQYSIRSGFVIDFALLDKMIAIEVDGAHWHSSKQARRKDRFKDYQLQRGGWTVIRIPEDQIDNLQELLSSISDESGMVRSGLVR